MKHFDLTGKRIFIAGNRGMVGAALVRRLKMVDCEILTVSREELDLRQQEETHRWIVKNKPDAVFVAAATVGGIMANNDRPAEFLYDNIMIAANVIEGARIAKVKKLLFLGSSCVYPKLASQPISENALLTGPLEPTNQWYAVAKIAAIKMCSAYRLQYDCDFISAQPTNLYGAGDTYELNSSHVIPALILKVHTAKVSGANEVEIWGTGTPRREFLNVEDLADALVLIMERYSELEPINIGYGEDVSISELAKMICEIVGFKGKLHYAIDKPDGTPCKLLDIRKLKNLGWEAKISLRKGLEDTYRSYLDRN